MSRDWLDAAAKRSPEAEALRVADLRLDYAGLAERGRKLAAELTLAGIRRGDLVATMLPAGLPAIVLFHALRARDAVLVPLNTRLSEEEQRYQLSDAGARVLVSSGSEQSERAGRLAHTEQLGLIHLDPAAHSIVRRELPAPSAEARDPLLAEGACAVLYTSGTCGRPKGAVLSTRALEASARAAAAHQGADASDRWLACMPLFHVAGISILVRAVLASGCVVVHEGFDALAVSRSLEADRITQTSLVADMLRRLLDARGPLPAPETLRCVLLGGGPAPDALLRRAASLHYPIAATYGLTETASQVATAAPSRSGTGQRCGLEPLPGTRVRIVDAAGSEQGPGEPGEICVHGPMLMRGYLGQREETARAVRDGWLHTGDIGVLDERGRLRILDRRDDLIISGGENIYPAEIEAVLAAHPAVSEAGVVSRPDARFGARPVAFIVARATELPTEEALNAYCRQRLAGYKIPVSFHPVKALPRNASGKLLRRELREGLSSWI